MNNIIAIDSLTFANVKAVTTQRQNGASKAPFDSFNLGCHVGDKLEHVQKNREILKNDFSPLTNIQWLNQVHKSDVAVIKQWQQQPITADASYTNKPSIALAILTADCLPILISNKQGTEIAAIHAGWRPLAANIINNTIAKFESPAKDLKAWLGPCISSKSFEVGVDVLQEFQRLGSSYQTFFKPLTSGKYLADLQGIAQVMLNLNGINDISKLSDCTYLQDNHYFSYRRDGQTGRMASVIAIQP
ncbi:peptidoglycan editing factor PgeF [Thalassotalea crassostreae]|uniref:peptidoglycan editing factor PgeF n=1 Tax=Thalassotalea crassostreae TaxID=1763536 RepID=UPI0009EE2024|nr:peptidoglycan editing factor PgeF [Thalassotalea crassostreae]